MSIFSWVGDKIKLYRWYDISLIKLSTAAFALMLAKFWPTILNLNWYCYAAVALIAAIVPIKRTFS